MDVSLPLQFRYVSETSRVEVGNADPETGIAPAELIYSGNDPKRGCLLRMIVVQTKFGHTH